MKDKVLNSTDSKGSHTVLCEHIVKRLVVLQEIGTVDYTHRDPPNRLCHIASLKYKHILEGLKTQRYGQSNNRRTRRLSRSLED